MADKLTKNESMHAKDGATSHSISDVFKEEHLDRLPLQLKSWELLEKASLVSKKPDHMHRYADNWKKVVLRKLPQEINVSRSYIGRVLFPNHVIRIQGPINPGTRWWPRASVVWSTVSGLCRIHSWKSALCLVTRAMFYLNGSVNQHNYDIGQSNLESGIEIRQLVHCFPRHCTQVRM